jgi:VIT1/CCC1 family predicted Fe2+/Mn2+ transporter
MEKETLECALHCQKMEINQYRTYLRLIQIVKTGKLAATLEGIAKDEQAHYAYWKKYTGRDVKPDEFQIILYSIFSRIFGVSFVMKLMEKAEFREQLICADLRGEIQDVDSILDQERRHESLLTSMIDELHLAYVGAFFRGMYIAIVQMTGVLAGLNLALHNTRLIAIAALAMGVATGITMGGVGYLNGQVERRKAGGQQSLWNQLKNPLTTSAVDIGMVFVLVSPYLAMEGYAALSVSICISLAIIGLFAFYISVIQDDSFKRIISQMVMISIITAVLSFIAGNLLSLLPKS